MNKFWKWFANKTGWSYYEMWTHWSCWSVGYTYLDGRGWTGDEIIIHFLTFDFTFVKCVK